MRKVLAVAIVTMLVFGTVGVLTVAEEYDSSEVVKTLDPDSYSTEDLNDEYGVEIGSLEGFEKILVVEPEGIEGGDYEVKNEESSGKVLVIVDPIHVRGP